MIDGTIAETAMVSLDREQVEQLQLIGQRLRRIAPHEDNIRRMVTGQ
jgi:hypothetical protein